MTIEWITPDAGLQTTLLELTEGTPVYQMSLTADDDIVPDSPIYFELVSGEIPEYYEIIQTGSTQGYINITPIVREMDTYVDGYQKDSNFTYDTESQAGGNYASYGSALAQSKTFTFTIRAYNATGLTTYEDSNGNTQYILDSAFLSTEYADRSFSITINNDYSSTRDSFILEYYDGQTILYNGVEYDTPEEFLIAIKNDGYYN